MRDATKLFLFIALMVMLIGALVGVVAVIDATQRNVFFYDSEPVKVISIQDTVYDGYIDSATMMYRRGYWDISILLETASGDTFDFHPAYIPDSLTVGDSVVLHHTHSPLFQFHGSRYVIEYGGEYVEHFNVNYQ